jgi:hypothetical protein
LKALIINEPGISRILRGEKTWEMRNKGCRHRGPIALIRKGSGHVVGVAELAVSLPAIDTPTSYAEAAAAHRIAPERQAKAFADGRRIPWVMEKARALPKPVPYRHPSGAVIWVNLDPEVVAAIKAQL